MVGIADVLLVLTLSTVIENDDFEGVPMPEDTKAKILRATRTLIDEEGLDAVTLRAVGAEGGLSRGAAYRHFANKEELLAAVAAEDFEVLMATLVPLESQPLNPSDLLTQVLENYYAFGISHRVHYQLMFATPWAQDSYPVLHEKGKLAFDKLHQMIVQLLVEHRLPVDDAVNKTAILFAFIHGLVELHLAGHNEKLKGLGNPQQLISLFIRNISTAP
jgi:AcrR family transcriptional regulator